MPSKPSLGMLILRNIPMVMRTIRHEMKEAAASQLTIPQFRVLAHLSHGNETISSLANYQGVSVPAMSKMLDGLAERKFLCRKACTEDRRTQWIELLPKGRKTYAHMEHQVEIKLNDLLRRISTEERRILDKSLPLFQSLFSTRTDDVSSEIKNVF